MIAPQLLGLIPIAALFGNELATSFIHRSFSALGTDEHLAAEKAIHRVLGRVMPIYMITAIGGAVGLTVASDRGTPTLLGTASVVCLLAMLAITLLGNVPINNETVRLDAGVETDRWRRLRRRWNDLHAARVALDAAAFGSALFAIATSA